MAGLHAWGSLISYSSSGVEDSIHSVLNNTTLTHLTQRQSYLSGQGTYQI